jgi:dTDP-4-amino-4,6-dideoxygalactose transaminase
MIPAHLPPFGLGRALLALLDRRRPVRVEDVEAACAEAYDIPQAVLLPSARAGICWSLQATVSRDDLLLCPAYTCFVVHEAAFRSPAWPQMLDIAPGGFLMDPAVIRGAARAPYSLILCETYGHAYDLAALETDMPVPPTIRVVDMAMTLPTPSLLARLRGNDFAVTSLGAGKCLYAGWGGLGLTRDRALAGEVRKLRDVALAPGSPVLAARRAATLARAGACRYMPAGLMRKVLKIEPPKPLPDAPERHGPFREWCQTATLSAEWRLPSSRPDRYLAMYNVGRTEASASCRLELAARYHRNFEGATGIARPPASPYPLSFYTIRVRAEARLGVWQRLWKAGIAATALFEFLTYLDPREFPQTWRTAAEVINLPLFEGLSAAQADRISEQVIRCVESAGG